MNKGLCRITAFVLMAAVMLSGCTGNKAYDEVAVKENTGYKGITVSNNVNPDEGSVLTCIAGYEKKGSKKALIQDMDGAGDFEVIDVNADKAVFKGRVKYRKEESEDGNAVGVCDFPQ